MHESTSTNAPPPILGARVAAWLGAVLLIGLLLLALFARVDRARLASLEKFSETTAVGDGVYYALPSPLPQKPAAVARIGGESLVPVDYERIKHRDSTMQPVARDPETKLTIYTVRGADGDAEYFVKIGGNEYLKLRAAK